MAEWKLTNQAIGTESQWKLTGKTYEQMPNKPQKEESMFPSVDELAKANIKADQLKQVIPSKTYDPSFQYSSKISPAITKLTKGEALTNSDINEILDTSKAAAGDTKLTETDRRYFKSLSDTLAKYSEDKNTAYVDLKNAAEKYKMAKSSDRTALEKALDFIYNGMKADDNYSQEEKKLRDAAVKYYAYEGITSEEKAKSAIKDLKRQNSILKRQNENGSFSKDEIQKSKQTIKENEEKISLLNVMVYGKDPDLWDTIQLAAQSIPANILSSISSTGDAIVNTAAKWLGAKGDIVNTRQTMKGVADDINASVAENTAAMGDKYNISGNLINAVSSTLPSAVISIAAIAATGGAAAPSVLASGSSGIASIMTNPAFYTSFVMTYGNEYYDFIERGADPNIAFAAALTSAAINSFIEIGGGVETLPRQLALAPTGKKKFLEWFVSSLEEGGEELLQGAVSEIFARIGTGDFKTTPEEFTQFAKQGLYEGAMGVAGGAFLGGGQFAFNEIINYNSNKQYSDLGQYVKEFNNGSELQNVIDYAKTSDNQIIRSLVANPEQITNTAAGMAYSYMMRDINTAITSQQTVEAATNGLKLIINQVGIESPTVNGVAIPQYIETVLRLEGTMDDAINGIAKAAEIDTTATEINGREQTETLQPTKPQQEIIPTETAEKSPSAFEEKSAKPISTVKGDIIGEVVANNIGTKKLTSDQRQIKSIGKAFGVDIEFADVTTPSGLPADGIFKDGKIIIDYDTKDPVRYVVEHELTHFIEGNENYGDFVKISKKSNVYAKWVKNYSFLDSNLAERAKNTTSVPQLSGLIREDIINHYANNGVELSPELAEKELFAKFCGETFFTDAENQQKALNSLLKAAQTQKQRNSITQFFKDLIEWFKAKLGGNHNITLELVKLQNEWAGMIKETAELSENKKTAAERDGERYSIGYTTDNKPVAIIDDDILDGVPKSGWVNTVKNVLSEKFSNGIPISGRLIKVNAITKSEFTNSKYSKYLKSNDGTIYVDKFKSANNLDDILLASTNYINEDLKHTRKDSLKEFARGNVLIKVGVNEYSAEVIVGFTGGKSMILYDIVDFTHTTLNMKKDKSIGYANNAGSLRSDLSNNIKPQNGLSVNTYSMQTAEENSENAKKQKFSIPAEMNKEYLELAKDPEKNKARLQEMVDEAAKKWGAYQIDGKPHIFYHTTDYDFTVFKKGEKDGLSGKGIYFGYNRMPYGKRTIAAYLKMENPMTYQETYEIDGVRETANRIKMKIIPDVYEKFPQFDGIIGRDEVTVKDASQIKSADPVTYDNNGNVIPLSERFNSGNEDIRFSIPDDQSELKDRLDSGEITTEQYREATQKNWESAVNEYGAFQPEAEVPTPKSVDGKKSVTKLVNNILNHAALTEEQFDTLEVKTLMNEMSHEVFGDKKAVKKAEDAYKKGIAVEKWDKARTASKHVSKDDIAIGVLLIKKAIEDKNTVRFMETFSELAELATRGGQLVQAYSLISKMNGIGKLMTLQKMVDKMNSELDKKFNGKFEPIKIDETLAEQIAKSKLGEDITSIVEDVKQDIANQVPVTFLDKWNAWRYMAMLANPKTHIRNIVGNGIFTPFVRAKDIISATLEKAFIAEENRTKSIIIKREYIEFAQKDKNSEKVKSAFNNGGKYNDATDIQKMRQIFKTAALEWVRETNSNLLEAEDLFFKNRHYVHALAGYLQARNADLNNLDVELLDSAREYAINEAMKATFNDANALSTWLNAAARQNIAADIFIGGTLPFKKTPINIVRRGFEYSPLGLLKTLTKGIYDLKSGKINSSEFIDGLGAGISGTVPALVGMLLVSLGWATGSFGDDKEEKFRILNGEQEYSLQILGKSYTVDWAAPACIPFFIGVEVMNAYDGKFTFANLVDASMASFDPIINLSCLSGIQETTKSVKFEEDGDEFSAIITSILSSYAGQPFPSAFGAVARTMDDTRRTTYVDKNSNIPETIQRVAQTSQAKIPFLENQKSAMIDNWGRRVSNGTVTERVLENFVSPGYYSKVDYDKVNKELARLSKSVGDDVLPPRSKHYIKYNNKRIDFTAAEYEKFATARGTKSFEIVEAIINNNLYKKMDDSQKADAIKEVYDYAFEYAKSQVSDFEMKSSFKRISNFSTAKLANYFIAKARV